MEKFIEHSGLLAPFDRANIDTDLIIPKQFLKSIKRTGFGPNLFDSLRYLDEGFIGQDISARPLNPDFILNQSAYREASILLARENFGCGSSREHAPWALLDYGFRAVLAPSFADIFYNNSTKNGLLPVTLPAQIIDTLFQASAAGPLEVSISLPDQAVSCATLGLQQGFEIDEFRKHCLLQGLDEIGLSLQSSDAIRAFEARQAEQAPWLYQAETE